ncbi:SULTR4 [Symbiodinium natans]|uniref:SULTR4 protein n=1 Tax=Symbiodinium natans TaxID=878477 RepID=A0A812L7H1_9DINO|nr:SULTR4 [Symbiodinium natans]
MASPGKAEKVAPQWDFQQYIRKKHLLRPLRPESQQTFLAWLGRRLPLFSQLRQASWTSTASDLIAGLTVGVMGVPESLSYASIAALPFEYGLYALVMPQLVYSLLGQSRQLMVGPVAMLSLLVHAGLEGSLDPVQCPEWFALQKNETAEDFNVLVQSEVCQEKYIAMTILTSLLAGSFLLLACVLQLGFLLKFLGHPVVSGFSTGSALIIMISQFKNFLGVKVEESEFPILSILSLIEHAPKGQPITLAFGLVFTATLVGLRKFGYAYPRWKLIGSLGPLISCVSGVLLIYFVEPLQHIRGLDYVHEVPGGSLPTSLDIMSSWTAHDVAQTMPLALSTGFLGFLEAFATAQNLAKQHGYDVESSQELLALGACNVVGAFFTAYPVIS